MAGVTYPIGSPVNERLLIYRLNIQDCSGQVFTDTFIGFFVANFFHKSLEASCQASNVVVKNYKIRKYVDDHAKLTRWWCG